MSETVSWMTSSIEGIGVDTYSMLSKGEMEIKEPAKTTRAKMAFLKGSLWRLGRVGPKTRTLLTKSRWWFEASRKKSLQSQMLNNSTTFVFLGYSQIEIQRNNLVIRWMRAHLDDFMSTTFSSISELRGVVLRESFLECFIFSDDSS